MLEEQDSQRVYGSTSLYVYPNLNSHELVLKTKLTLPLLTIYASYLFCPLVSVPIG